jgi:hypothetical protein
MVIYKSSKGVTSRSVFIALALVIPNAYWSIQRGMIWGGAPTTLSLFYNVVFTLFVLTLLNVLLRKISSRFALHQSELLVIYVMLSLATAVGGFDTIQVITQILGHPFWSATPENEWQELFWNHVPSWLTVSDLRALKGYYEGNSSLYASEHFKAWLKPVAWWTAMLTAMAFAMLCLNVILRKQWTEREKLSYPIIQLPLSMTSPDRSAFWRNRMLWFGFILAASLDTLNSLHSIFPSVPGIPLRSDIRHLFTEEPWNAIGRIRIGVMPFAMGLAFIMPLALSFSCWFFFLFWKAQRLLGAVAGWQSLPGYPYEEAQSSGAYLAIGLISLWLARSHLWHLVRAMFGKVSMDDSDGPMRYRSALIGLMGSLTFLTMLCWRAGMTVLIAMAFWGIYMLLSVAITWMRAELGHPAHELYWRGPDAILTTTVGPQKLGATNLTVFSTLWGITRAQRGHIMPHQLEGFKLASIVRMNSRRLWGAMMLAVALGAFVSFWLMLDLSYQSGAFRARWGDEAFRRLERWLTYPSGADVSASIFMLLGFCLSVIFMFMKVRFLWWSLHPVAYPLANSFTLTWIWFSIFLSWLAKWSILRLGGLKSYRQALPFFLGLILGEFITGGLWSIIGIVIGMPVYVFW